jgi:hypothetical protein
MSTLAKAAALFVLARESATRKLAEGTAVLIDEQDSPAFREIDLRNAEYEDQKRWGVDYNLSALQDWLRRAREKEVHDGATNVTHGQALPDHLGPNAGEMG